MEKVKPLLSDGTLWIPGSYSSFSSNYDSLFYFIFWLSVIFTIAIVGVTLYFSFKYKRSESNLVAKKQIVHNNKLEIIWTAIPFVIVMFIFYWGFKDYLYMTVSPENAYEVRVTGKKWFWTYEYPETGVKTVGELVVPVGRPIKLVMSSTDVLHSFYIPNLRVKRDVVPNKYSNLWFDVTQEGIYQIFCTEYCGDQHSNMDSKLIVKSYEDFLDWMEEQKRGASKDVPLDLLGKKLYKEQGCNSCHSLDGSVVVGPSWKGIYGAQRLLADGSEVKVDDNYLRESIVYPAKKIVKGYPNIMASYAGLLSDREINGIIEYIKTLK
ncbi:cytochrome c oxidase subunit II [Candidatus Marinamargulisbacteria bacterium SCGC AG-343-D04]|nr:cytochrome c oxidase subunit II [Candidatus Marinamargulisbacteria bacterium SCGC AG-343-D04]